MHPQLFQGLIFIEPVIQETIPPGPNAALFTSLRPDLWNSFEEAKTHFMNNKFYKSWDRRALEKYIQHGLRSTPTALHPNAPVGAVTLATPKTQEAWSYVRSTFSPLPQDDQLDDRERLITGDYTSEHAKYLFIRSEAAVALNLLPHVKPSVKWIFGGKSYINRPTDRDEKISRTGTASRGNGGVSVAVIERGGHLVPLEMISETADEIAPYIQEQLGNYVKEKAFWATYDSGKSKNDSLELSDQWIKNVRQGSGILRPVNRKGKL